MPSACETVALVPAAKVTVPPGATVDEVPPAEIVIPEFAVVV